ncbi:MAG: tetratricopeptide repeat protein [Polyangiaceae bacterium]
MTPRSPSLRTLLPVALVAIGPLVPGVAAAEGSDPVLARQLLKEGYELAKAGRCDEAVSRFETSQTQDPQPKTLLNLARCEEELGRFGAALGHWSEARDLARERKLRATVAEAEVRIVGLESRMPSLTVRVEATDVANVNVLRDGRLLPEGTLGRPLPVDPGEHTLEVSAEGRETNTLVVRIDVGESKSVDVSPGKVLVTSRAVAVPANEVSRDVPTSVPVLPSGPDDARPESVGMTRPLFWGGLGVAALGVAVGTASGAVALSQAPELRAKCDGGCSRDTYDRVEGARGAATLSTVAFGVAGAGALTATLAWVLGPKSGSTAAARVAPTVAVVPWAGPGSAGAVTTVRY